MNLLELHMAYVEPFRGSARYNRWSILTAAAAALERRVWFARGRFGVLFPNMYTILVGDPATGKTTSAQFAVEPLYALRDKEKKPFKIGSTKITQAALYNELKEAERSLVIPPVGQLVQSSLFVYAAELAINMADFGGGILTNELIDFYDSKGLWSQQQKHTVGKGLTILHNPGVTLLGCTTPEYLASIASTNIINSGLSSRIVFVVETGEVLMNFDEIEPDPVACRAIQTEIARLYSMRGPMSWDSPETHARYKEIANTARITSRASTGLLKKNYYARKQDHIIKIAMVLAAIHGRMTIRLADIEEALRYLEEVEPDMTKAFGVRNVEKDPDTPNRILACIPEDGRTVTMGEVLAQMQQAGHFMPQNGALEAILKSFQTAGIIVRDTGSGGSSYLRRVVGKS